MVPRSRVPWSRGLWLSQGKATDPPHVVLIISRAGIPSIESMLLHRQLRWLGHVIRFLDNRLPHRVLYGQLRLVQRRVGGQKMRFKIHIKSISNKCKILLAVWRLSHLPEQPVPLDCHALTLNTIELQLLDAVADTSMLHFSAKSRFVQQCPLTMLLTHWPPQPQ